MCVFPFILALEQKNISAKWVVLDPTQLEMSCYAFQTVLLLVAAMLRKSLGLLIITVPFFRLFYLKINFRAASTINTHLCNYICITSFTSAASIFFLNSALLLVSTF